MIILNKLRHLIKRTLLTEAHPVFYAVYQHRRARIAARMSSPEYQLQTAERNSRMTYAQIEAQINRTYERIFGRKVNWDNPRTYTEKMQAAKLYMSSPLKTKLADKYLVCEWIREKIGGEYLVPLLGVYDSFDEIDFDVLPSQFVIKCNHDCGSVTIVTDKSKLNLPELKHKYDILMKRNYAFIAWEMQYKDIKPKIIIEQYIDNAAVNDYRFFCFDGKPYYCAIDFHNKYHMISERNFYGMNWELYPFTLNYHNHAGEVQCPDNFDELKEVALKLCQGIDQVRVDLYSAGGKVYFGEMTFTHSGGFQRFRSDEWDYRFGELWQFDNTIRPAVLAKYSRPSEI